MQFTTLKNELVEAMTETVKAGRCGSVVLYGSTTFETKDGIISVDMFPNCNRVYIIHQDEENERECKNLEAYLEDNLPLWNEIIDKVNEYPSNQCFEYSNHIN